MRTLTVISLVLLPLSLLAGIYGMNVSLPFDKSPYAFYGLIGFMVALIVGLVLLFRGRKWI